MSQEKNLEQPPLEAPEQDRDSLNQQVDKKLDQARKKIEPSKTHVANFANEASNNWSRS